MHDFLNIWFTSRFHVMLCHGHGQKYLTMTVAKISKLLWSNGQKIFGQDLGQSNMVIMVKINHGVHDCAQNPNFPM